MLLTPEKQPLNGGKYVYLKDGLVDIIITGLPTHNVGGQTSSGLWCLSSSLTLHGSLKAASPAQAR